MAQATRDQTVSRFKTLSHKISADSERHGLTPETTTLITEVCGSFHRFGEAGVAYEVVDLVDEATVTIRVLESGEQLTYPLSEVLLDPAA